ncbi:MAG: hypothetical protein PVG75_05665 [Thioalkalispiraceae bacterium]|jgi:hypothetical protein
MKNLTTKMYVVVLFTATMLFTPGISYAGWFGDKAQKVKTRVKATPGNVQQKVQDMSQKLNEIHQQIAENRPLMEKMKNGKMMDSLKEVVEFIIESQQEYQAFANRGVNGFRQDFSDMLYGFGYIINEAPALENADRLNDRLDTAMDLMDKIPSQFLFIMHKAVGNKLHSISDNVNSIRNDLGQLPRLPKPSELNRDPYAFEVELCSLVNSRANAVRIAVIKNRLKTTIWTMKTITSYLPDDLTFDVTVVGGGGFTATKHPAQVPFKIPLTILEAIELSIDNRVALANAMCTGVEPESK